MQEVSNALASFQLSDAAGDVEAVGEFVSKRNARLGPWGALLKIIAWVIQRVQARGCSSETSVVDDAILHLL